MLKQSNNFTLMQTLMTNYSNLSSSLPFDEESPFGNVYSNGFANLISSYIAASAQNNLIQSFIQNNFSSFAAPPPDASVANTVPTMAMIDPSNALPSGSLQSFAISPGPAMAPAAAPAPAPGSSFITASGTSGADTLIGTADADTLNGLGGNDIIHGMGGNDTLYGGTGDDVIYAYNNTTGDGTGTTTTVTDYTQNFSVNTGGFTYTENQPGGSSVTEGRITTDGAAANGSLQIDIQRTGGSFTNAYGIYTRTITATQDLSNAQLTFAYRHWHANQNDNGENSYVYSRLNAGGWDTVSTGLGQNGQTDTGWVTYTYNLGNMTAGTSITIDLAHLHSGSNGNNEDSYARFDDVTLRGDVVSGSGGGAPSTTLDAGTINTLYGEAGNDSLYGAAGNDIMYGGANNDYLFGGFGNDVLNGGSGADILNGGAGTDTLDYSGSSAAVTVNLATNTVSGGDAAGDTISNFENIRGSDHNDNLTGDANVNVIEGGNGNDTINAGGGNDIVWGGNGSDIINGDAGNDVLHGASALDINAILLANPGVVYNTSTGNFYQFVNTGARLSRTAADGLAGSATLAGSGGLTGHLATITSLSEMNTVLSIQDTSNAWIAGSDSATEGVWVWDRGSEAGQQYANATGASVNGMYNNWVAGQPNDGDGTQDYMYLYYNAGNQGWADAPDNPWAAVPNFVDIFSYVIEWQAGAGADDNAADTINGGDGDDIIYGYGGGDNLSGGNGADTIYGGAGNDTINGDGGNDTLYGGDGDDIINGGGNNDNIYGGAGADTINGGANNDTVFYTSETADIIIDLNGGVGVGGEAQGDTLTSIENLYSGSGNDIITGSTANNNLYGGAGNDTIRGGDGNDNIYGQNGDDIFYAENGNDFFYGGVGYDTIIFSGNFADYSYTTPGIVGNTYAFTFTDNNTSDGNDGVDYIESVELLVFNDITIDVSDPNNIRYAPLDITFSNDRINYNDAIGTTVATMTTTDYDGGPHTYTFLDGDTGFFTISGNEIRLNADVSGFKNQIFYLSVQTEDGDGLTYSEDYFVTILGDTTTITNDTDDTINGNSDDEALYGYGGNDIINGGDGDDEIFGGAGADTMDGGAGFDVVRFDTATNDLVINLTTSTVTGGGIAAVDTFINFEGAAGGIGNDTIIGTSGKNSLYGNRGNDIINGGAGDDKIWGGDGADTMDGGDGIDFLRYDYDVIGVNVNLGTGAASGGQATGDVFTNFEGVTGGFGNDILTGGAGNDRLDGNAGNDILTGGAGRDVIQGCDGDDIIDAGDDDDNVYGGMGADTMEGGAGIDTLRYEADIAGVSVNLLTGAASGGEAEGDIISNFENLNGGHGNDTLTGDAGNNVINGRDGNDVIDGGDGNDNLYGDDGDDIIFGGAGDDNIWGGAGADQINGGAGTDTLRYTDDNTGMTINLTTGVGSGGYAQGDTYTNLENVFAGNGDDIITGDAGRNTIRGYGGNDIIDGGGDKDNIDGGKGDDILYGGAGDDTLYGDDGNDILYGGAGIDTLTGGAGADTFVFDDLSSSDRIRDFNAAEGDILDISSLLSGFTGGSDIHEYLQFTEDRGRTRVMVDADGAANGENFVQATVMDNATGLDIDTLYANGQIITI